MNTQVSEGDRAVSCALDDWAKTIDVRGFVLEKTTPYDGGAEFLVGPTKKSAKLWEQCKALMAKEQSSQAGVLDVDTETISTVTSHKPGYIDKDVEVIVGLQTDAPLKRAIKPFGGVRAVQMACEESGKTLSPYVTEIFTTYRKTHNDGVFSAYTEEMRKLRKTGILTGLPDAYARGRIIGDYRRVALYGIERLIEAKEADKAALEGVMTDELIRAREETTEQIFALHTIQEMAQGYGFDISKPAQNAKEAIQWTYFAYLAALKEQDGAAMSLGNVSGFFDIYLEEDIRKGILTEEGAQELVDQFIIKLRLVRHLRPADYNHLFAGDPTWLTESLGGMWCDGRHKVTKTSYRFLQTLYNFGPSPEPNLTVLWAQELPQAFKDFCAKVSIETSSIQYENDDVMRDVTGADDYAISCCVSKLTIGKEMQFFGARCNIAKALLLALNEGRDEITGIKIMEGIPKLKAGEYLDYAEVLTYYKQALKFLAAAYADTMNVIHYMHDKYYYERVQMALLDTDVKRIMAFGAAGLSVAADSLSAIKYAKVKPVRNDDGLTIDFVVEGEYPQYGNDDDRADKIAVNIVKFFNEELGRQHIYRDAMPTLSILTITSNVVYGKKTGSTPDGRHAGEPFAPGANPMHGRDVSGAIASLNSVAKINYEDARDGVSNTFSVTPSTLGNDIQEQTKNLTSLLDGYFAQGAHHLNVNVMNRDLLLHAMEHPEEYPQLTIRVSGYAVKFVNLSREQQQEVISRTFFESL
ncbi:MAG: formate C-acetyltransferase [Candidatus Moranbacteria bacterium]|nr:formate C-acetyltransferase [Candidatus Moranbacteria bacterium]